MWNKKISVLGDHDLVFFRFGSFNSICQNSHSIFYQTVGSSFFLAVHTAATDTDFEDFQWISDTVVNTEAEYCKHITSRTDNNMVCVQTKTSLKRGHQFFFPLNYAFVWFSFY